MDSSNPTSLKLHLLRMCIESQQYEEAKMYEALQGSNKTVQAQQRNKCKIMANAYIRLADWKPTISH